MENIAIEMVTELGKDLKYCVKNKNYELFEHVITNFLVEIDFVYNELLNERYDKAIVQLEKVFEENAEFLEDTIRRIEAIDKEEAIHFAELIDIILDGEGKWVKWVKRFEGME